MYGNPQYRLFSPRIIGFSWESDLAITLAGSKSGVAEKKNGVRPVPGVLLQSTEGRKGSHHRKSNREPGRRSAPCSTDAPYSPAWLRSRLVCCYPASSSKMKRQDSGIYQGKPLLPIFRDLSAHRQALLSVVITPDLFVSIQIVPTRLHFGMS